MNVVKKALVKVTWHNGKEASSDRVVGRPDGLLSRLIPFDSGTKTGGVPNMSARRFEGDPRSRTSVNSFNGPWGRLEYTYGLKTPLYVVWSYLTPIAYVKSDGTIEIPEENYSRTTKHHQGLCRAWMGQGRVWSDQDKTHIFWTTQAVRDAEKGTWV